jgi:Holliday junction resolvase RusA-like endonuclease
MLQFDFSSLDHPQTLMLPIPPVPASRPKVARFGTYYSKRHQEYVRSFAGYLKLEPPQWNYLPKEVQLIVGLEFVCKRPKRLTIPSPAYDIDNLIKLPLDCMTSAEIFWHDDVQITTVMAHKRYADKKEEPHTLVRVFAY